MSMSRTEQVEHSARRERAIKRIRKAERPTTQQLRVRLMMQYLGVVTLLGRIAKHLPAGHEDRYGLDKAMRDANNLLLCSRSTICYMRSSDGGYGAFDRKQLKEPK